jgi:hypothetical protein
MGLLAFALLGVAYIHLVWLPRHRVNLQKPVHGPVRADCFPVLCRDPLPGLFSLHPDGQFAVLGPLAVAPW